MSGTTDTSTPASRAAFCSMITSGGPGSGMSAATAAVSNCTLQVPVEVAALLSLPDAATYARAAAQIRGRWSAGQAAF